MKIENVSRSVEATFKGRELMGYSKLMKERIRRVTVLFKELGFEVLDGEYYEDTYTAGFESGKGFQGGFFIDNDSKFLEITYTFSFSLQLADFIKENLEEMMHTCYEFGCYTNIEQTKKEITFSIFSKLYYSGMNYYSLRDTMRDFRDAVDTLQDLLSIQDLSDEEDGDEDEDEDEEYGNT